MHFGDGLLERGGHVTDVLEACGRYLWRLVCFSSTGVRTGFGWSCFGMEIFSLYLSMRVCMRACSP